MPVLSGLGLNPEADDVWFEMLVRDLCAAEWGDPNTKRYGRSGQKQHGVDCYGRLPDPAGGWAAAQCKAHQSGKRLTVNEVKDEIEKTRGFELPLSRYVVATTAPRDGALQIEVDRISEKTQQDRGFSVAVWFWEDIEERLDAYPQLFVRYYWRQLKKLTNIELAEELVDKPLRVVMNYAETRTSSNLTDALRLCGIEPYEILDKGCIEPDGCVIELGNSDMQDSSLSHSDLLMAKLARHCNAAYPIFIHAPEGLTESCRDSANALGINSQRITFLPEEESPLALARRVLCVVFPYGYRRRGGLRSVGLSIRTSGARPCSALLDADWQSEIDMKPGGSRFPSPDEWAEKLHASLTAITDQVVGLGHGARIYITSILPIPAAVAVGFHLNVRVATIVVRARQQGASQFSQQFWHSDSAAEPADVMFEETCRGISGGKPDAAVLELSTSTNITAAIECFLANSQLRPGMWLRIERTESGGNIEEAEAVAYANQVAYAARHLREQGVCEIHLFANVPSALAVLIGQRLQACGEIHLYWYINSGSTYRYAFTLS